MSQSERGPLYAFSTPTSGDDEQARLFSSFRQSGFSGLQLKGSQYARYIGRPSRFLADWGDDEGVRSALIHGSSLDPQGVDSLREVIAFASGIGSGIVVFCHARPRDSVNHDDIRLFARELSRLGEEAATVDVKISLHNHFDNPVMHRGDFDVFFGSVEPGTIGLTLDTAHLAKSGVEDIAGIVRDFGVFIDNVHLKDFRDGQFATLGRGRIDFESVFAALHEIDFQGWLCADEESDTAVEESLKESFEFLDCGWRSAPHDS